MTKTFQLLGGALGVDLPDGRSLRADRRGRVVVDDADAAAFRGSSAMRRYDAIIEVASYRRVSGPDDRVCDCGFAPWPWQRECPRCGDALPALAESS